MKRTEAFVRVLGVDEHVDREVDLLTVRETPNDWRIAHFTGEG